MKTNSAGIALIMEFEACRLEAYQDQKGVWTIGWGHTSAAGPPGVVKGLKIRQDDANDIFIRDLQKFEVGVIRSIDRFMNENQFAAFVSLAYNIGTSSFRQSTACKAFNAGMVAKAADAFTLWNKITDQKTGKKVYSRGLDRRRKAERELFLKPVQNVIPERVQPPSPPEVVAVPPIPEIAVSEADYGFWHRLWRFITRS